MNSSYTTDHIYNTTEICGHLQKELSEVFINVCKFD